MWAEQAQAGGQLGHHPEVLRVGPDPGITGFRRSLQRNLGRLSLSLQYSRGPEHQSSAPARKPQIWPPVGQRFSETLLPTPPHA